MPFRLILVAVSVAVAALAGPPAASAAAEDVVDGPGHYFVFRTLDSGDAPTETQDARCRAYFGARSPTVVTRLNARLFSFDADPGSGRIVDQTAALLGPGFICGAPTLSGPSALDAYSYASLPGPGLITLNGNCDPRPLRGSAGNLAVNCVLEAPPTPATGLLGAVATSNSIVDQTRGGLPTGSVWTAYGIQAPGTPPQAGDPLPPSAPKPDRPGIDFYVGRARDQQAKAGDPACGPGTTAVRRAGLSAVQPNRSNGQIPDAVGPSIAAMTVCYGADLAGVRVTTASFKLKAGARMFDVAAVGTCREKMAAGLALPVQACALSVAPSSDSGVTDGLITSSQLVDPGAPASARNSGVWTIGLLGAPAAPAGEAAGPAGTPVASRRKSLRVRILAPRRTRRSRIVARWKLVAGGDRTARFDVQRGRRGSRRFVWRTFLRATARTRVRIGLGKPGLEAVRVRARRDGRVGHWSTVRVRVLRPRPVHRRRG